MQLTIEWTHELETQVVYLVLCSMQTFLHARKMRLQVRIGNLLGVTVESDHPYGTTNQVWDPARVSRLLRTQRRLTKKLRKFRLERVREAGLTRPVTV